MLIQEAYNNLQYVGPTYRKELHAFINSFSAIVYQHAGLVKQATLVR